MSLSNGRPFLIEEREKQFAELAQSSYPQFQVSSLILQTLLSHDLFTLTECLRLHQGSQGSSKAQGHTSLTNATQSCGEGAAREIVVILEPDT